MKIPFCLVLILSLNTFAQNKKIDLSFDDDHYESVWDVEKENLLSPFTTPAVWVLAGGTLLTYYLYNEKERRGEIGFQEDHNEVRRGTWQYYGNIIGWAALQGVYTLTQLPGIYRGEQRAIENTEIMWKSTIYTSLTTGAMKLFIKEQRQDSTKRYESFPSGHASAAFAFATNLAIRHEWYWSVLAAPFVLAASTSRVSTDSHYAHDAVFGAALGISFAYGMNYVSEKRDVPFLLGYEPMEDGGGLHLKYKF